MNPALVMMLGFTLTSVSEVPNFLAGLLPSLMTIGRFAADPEDRAKLRRGEVIGMTLAFGTALGLTFILKSNDAPYWWLPLAGTAIVGGVLLYEYESAIAKAQNENHAERMDHQPDALLKRLSIEAPLDALFAA